MQYENIKNEELFQLDDNKSEGVVNGLYEVIHELNSTLDEILSFSEQDYKQSFVITIPEEKSVNETLGYYFDFINRSDIVDFRIYYIDVHKVLLYFQNREDAALFKTWFLLGN